MKPNTKSALIHLEGQQFQQDLINYLNSPALPGNDQANLQDLLQTGLNVRLGRYRDQQLHDLTLKVDSLVAAYKATRQLNTELLTALRDIQDVITRQYSDVEQITIPPRHKKD